MIKIPKEKNTRNMQKGIITQLTKENNGREVAILRHGQTALNVADVIRGWSDVPLDEEGFHQARELGEAMVKENVELDGIFSSDLLRAMQTSVEVSKVSGIPILGTTKALRPWNVGKLTGTDGKRAHKIMSEYAKHEPDEELEGGESFNQFKNRFLVGLIGLLNNNRGLKLGFTSHSRGERIMHAWVAAGCPEDLEIDMEVFLEPGEGTATAQLLTIDSPLVLS